jgi:uncharacterized membrane protein
MLFLKLLTLSVPIFFAIDMLWLGVIARNFYRVEMGGLLRTDFNWTAAIIFYFIFLCGLVAFVIQPAVERADWHHALIWGAFFGFCTYATYDLTNLATLQGWTLRLTLVDILWGTVLAASVSSAVFFIHKAIS